MDATTAYLEQAYLLIFDDGGPMFRPVPIGEVVADRSDVLIAVRADELIANRSDVLVAQEGRR